MGRFIAGDDNSVSQDMEFKATLKRGPVEFEIWGDEGNEVRDELKETIEYLETNLDQFENRNQSKYSAKIQNHGDGVNEETDESNLNSVEEEGEGDRLQQIANKVRIPVEELERVFLVDEDEEMPTLFLEDMGILGDRKTDRQRRASLILLYLWHVCYGEERVKSSDLKDALQISGISDGSMGNMYQGKGDSYFDRAGRGPSATVALTPPGKRHARRAIQELFEELSEESSTEEREDEQSSNPGLTDF